MASSSRRIALASLFGGVIFVTLGFLPALTSDYLIAVEAFFLALSFLVVGMGGATYVGVVAGLLIGLVNPGFFADDIVFAGLFGLMVDVLGVVFRAKMGNRASISRLTIDVTVSTTVIGFIAYYVTAVLTNSVPNQVGLDATIIVFGVVSGAMAGYAAARVWNKYLSSRA